MACCSQVCALADDTRSPKYLNFSTFTPPSKAKYNIDDINFNDDHGQCFKKTVFNHPMYSEIKYPNIEVECYLLRKYKDKNKIVLLYIQNICKQQGNKVSIIFSHGGSSDLGVVYPFLVDLSIQLKVRVTN
jgi:hypothetical protein